MPLQSHGPQFPEEVRVVDQLASLVLGSGNRQLGGGWPARISSVLFLGPST